MSTSHARPSILVLVVALAMLTAGGPAAAQIDPNIQVRIDTFIPRPDVRVRPPETERVQVQQRKTVVVTEETPIPLAQRRALLAKSQKGRGLEAADISALPVAAQEAVLRKNNIPDSVKRQVKKTRVVTTTREVAKPRTIDIYWGGSGNFLYDSNATKSNRNRIADGSFADTNLLNVDIPIGVADTISLSSGVGVQRYMTLKGRSTDVVIGDAIYKKFLDAKRGPGGGSGTMTTDGVSFGVATRSIYQPGLTNHQVSLVTPAVAWSRSNIGLGDETNGTGSDQAYRYFANIVASVAYTFSDVASQENVAARTTLTVGWRTPVPGLTLTATGIVQGRHYTSFPGGREDLYVEANGAITWRPQSNVALSGLLTFAHQESSQRALIWTGFMASPQFRLDIKLN
jgi:hypothetical protein